MGTRLGGFLAKRRPRRAPRGLRPRQHHRDHRPRRLRGLRRRGLHLHLARGGRRDRRGRGRPRGPRRDPAGRRDPPCRVAQPRRGRSTARRPPAWLDLPALVAVLEDCARADDAQLEAGLAIHAAEAPGPRDPAYAVLHVGEPVRDPSGAPVVEAIEPGRGPVRTPGHRARPRPRRRGASPPTVAFGDRQAQVLFAFPEAILVAVPDGLPLGPTEVRVTRGGLVSAPAHVRGDRGRDPRDRGGAPDPRRRGHPGRAPRPRPRHAARRRGGRPSTGRPPSAPWACPTPSRCASPTAPVRGPARRDRERARERAVPRRGRARCRRPRCARSCPRPRASAPSCASRGPTSSRWPSAPTSRSAASRPRSSRSARAP